MNMEQIRMRTFGRGDQVVWRSLPQGNVGYVFPATIVCDDGDVIGLFQHTGSICKKRTGKRGGPSGRNMLPGGWDGGYSDREWAGRSNLHLHKMGSGHTVIRSWDPDQQRFAGWYVNLEAEWVRTPIGFDTRDLILDVTVADDLSSWCLKDEDELQWAQDEGIVSADEASFAKSEAKHRRRSPQESLLAILRGLVWVATRSRLASPSCSMRLG